MAKKLTPEERIKLSEMITEKLGFPNTPEGNAKAKKIYDILRADGSSFDDCVNRLDEVLLKNELLGYPSYSGADVITISCSNNQPWPKTDVFIGDKGNLVIKQIWDYYDNSIVLTKKQAEFLLLLLPRFIKTMAGER